MLTRGEGCPGKSGRKLPAYQHLLGLMDSRGTWTLAKESSGPLMGLPSGWKRGLPGPAEKGSRGPIAGAPGKKLDEAGFTRLEGLWAKEKRQELPAFWGRPQAAPTQPLPHSLRSGWIQVAEG